MVSCMASLAINYFEFNWKSWIATTVGVKIQLVHFRQEPGGYVTPR